jgi:taurine dioxygenase
MTIEATPLSPAIGALVRGVDLSRPLDEAAQATLRQVFYDHVILLIRDQKLDEDGLLRAGGFLGPLSRRGRPTAVQRESNPYITKVSNIRENGQLIGSLPDGEMLFHADASFFEMPHRASFLYAVEVPSAGGNTLFANMYKAYDLVPEALRRRLDGRIVVQEYDYATYEKADRAAGRTDNIRRHSHPIFITHPVTKRRSLFVNRLMTKAIEGLPRAESDAILHELFGYAEHPSVVYEHVWRPGDFLAWDNLCSNHARTDFSAAERRLLLRGTVAGDYRPQA